MSHDHFAAIREKADLVALVEELTGSKVKSRTPTDVRFIPCPFCGSKTGFSVNPQTKTYCCHHAGCEEKGDVFTFVKRVKGLTRNWDALKFLAERVGYDLPEARPLADEHLNAVLALAQEMKRAAAEYYASRFWACRDEPFTYKRDGEEHATTVLGYQMETRGHSEGVLKYMRVGWADGKLLAHLKERYRDHPDRKLAFSAMIASALVRKGDGGFHDLFCPGGYIYPVFAGDKVVTFTAKYPDDGIANYQVPRAVEINSQEVSVWGASFYFLNQDSLGAEDLVVVEGEDDLLSVMDLGGHAEVCGLRGTPNREQLAALAERRRGKRTFLCFDTDDAGKDLARQVAQVLAGPDYDVRVAAMLAEHKDIDDALRATGRSAAAGFFRDLLGGAKPAPEHLLDELDGIPAEKRSAHAEGLARLIIKYPPLEQEGLQKRMADALGASAKTVQQIFVQARKKDARKTKASPWRKAKEPAKPLSGDDVFYRWGRRGLEQVEFDQVEGQTVERTTHISNFLIRIEREAMVIDDLRDHREYECRVLFNKDPEGAGRPLRLEAAHFGSHIRLAEALSAAGHYDARCKSRLMDFLRLASSKYSEEKGVSHVKTVRYIGYAKDEDGEDLGYVTPSVVVKDGAVVPASEALKESGLRCELPSTGFKSVKCLDLALISPEELRAVEEHIMADLLRFKGPEVGRCFIGHTFLAPVLRRLPGFKPYVLALLGNSGLGKSTLAAYFQAFFGPKFTDLDLESWAGTPKAVELAGHTYKDALYVVDDFKLAHFSQAALRDAMRVLQGYADGAGRNRLSRSSDMLPSVFIRGALAITGEDLPEGESSNLARILPLRAPDTPVTPGLVAVKRRCDKMRRLYAGVMARYIAWTQEKGDVYLQERADELFETFAADPKIAPVVADNKTRVLQNLTLNCLGFVLWAEFTGEAGIIDEATAQRMVNAHFAFLKSLFFEHVATVSEERPFMLFLREVRAMIDSQVVRLAPVMEKPGGGFMLEKEQKGGNKPLVGYEDDKHVYLLHNAVFKEVGEYRARGRISAGEFSKRTIMKQLHENGILVPNPSGAGTNDVKKHGIYVDGERKRVIKIRKENFEG